MQDVVHPRKFGPPLRVLAQHEAGHALMLCALSYGVKRVLIKPPERRCFRWSEGGRNHAQEEWRYEGVTEELHPTSGADDVAVRMAGLIAEGLTFEECVADGRQEMDRARRDAEGLAVAEGATRDDILRREYDRVQQLLSVRKTQFDAISTHICGRLGSVDCVEITDVCGC